MRADTASVMIPELEFEIPPNAKKGDVTTVESILTQSVEGLEREQPLRKVRKYRALCVSAQLVEVLVVDRIDCRMLFCKFYLFSCSVPTLCQSFCTIKVCWPASMILCTGYINYKLHDRCRLATRTSHELYIVMFSTTEIALHFAGPPLGVFTCNPFVHNSIMTNRPCRWSTHIHTSFFTMQSAY